MPVLLRIAAKGGAAGDVDDPPGDSEVEELRDGELAEVGGGLEVDPQRPVPGRVPLLVGRIVGDGFVDSGIVDEDVDLPAELVERGLPDLARRLGVGEVAGDQLVASKRGMAADLVAVGLEQGISGRADAAARSGDEDVHGSLPILPGTGRGTTKCGGRGRAAESPSISRYANATSPRAGSESVRRRCR